MGVIIIGPQAEEYPARVVAPWVEVKREWADDWQDCPELFVQHASVCAAGADLDQCELRRRYGSVKLPWEVAFSAKSPWASAAGWWVRLRWVGQEGIADAWIGRISNDVAELQGSTSHGPSGRQSFVAYGPLQILRKRYVSQSWWREGADEKLLGWIPSVNSRDERGLLRGNRRAAKSGDTYVYGGSSTWTHYEYLEYLLARFIDDSTAGGPKWTIGGQAALLKDLSTVIPLGTTQTAAEILRQLIDPKFGVDYKIVPTEDGFEVQVFALQSREYAFGGKTLPKNPNTLRVNVSRTSDNIQTTIVRSEDHGYGRVRVLGKRIVVCCSLHGVEGPPISGSLVAKWHDDLETAYKAGRGAGTYTAEDHDKARQEEKYRAVYQAFGAPADWDFLIGSAAPKLGPDGVRVPGETADYQTTVRRTLSWTPLRENVDYSTDPLTDSNPTGHEGDFRPPAAWLSYYDTFHNLTDLGVDGYYVPAESEGVSVHAPQEDWGVILEASPNHKLALNHWSGAAETEVSPSFDHEKIVCTIAFESDQRLVYELAIPDAQNCDGVMEIEADAEYWYAPEATVVGVETSGGTFGDLKRIAAANRVLRDDTPHCLMVMAGALARYHTSRCRAEVVAKGWKTWGGLVGHVLTMVDDGGHAQEMQAVITAVEWQTDDKGSPLTRIKTGFAQ